MPDLWLPQLASTKLYCLITEARACTNIWGCYDGEWNPQSVVIEQMVMSHDGTWAMSNANDSASNCDVQFTVILAMCTALALASMNC